VVQVDIEVEEMGAEIDWGEVDGTATTTDQSASGK